MSHENHDHSHLGWISSIVANSSRPNSPVAPVFIVQVVANGGEISKPTAYGMDSASRFARRARIRV